MQKTLAITTSERHPEKAVIARTANLEVQQYTILHRYLPCGDCMLTLSLKTSMFLTVTTKLAAAPAGDPLQVLVSPVEHALDPTRIAMWHRVREALSCLSASDHHKETKRIW